MYEYPYTLAQHLSGPATDYQITVGTSLVVRCWGRLGKAAAPASLSTISWGIPAGQGGPRKVPKCCCWASARIGDATAGHHCRWQLLVCGSGLQLWLADSTWASQTRNLCIHPSHERFFLPWMDTSRFENFEAYVSHMETDGAYGDELSLQSAAHLFVRPIRVIGEDPEKDRLFQPPESISADCWGAPVFLSYVAFNHFEATEPLRVKEELPA